mgnify:CR=1 FL=1
MKKKIILTGCVILVTALASTAVFTAKNKTIIFNESSKQEVDLEVAKTKKPHKLNTKQLTKDLSKNSLEKEVVLDVAWGDKDEQFILSKYQESPNLDVRWGTPSSFAVHKNGDIYVADSINHKIKVFSKNKLKEVIPFEESINQSYFVMNDISVDDEGNIYGVVTNANEVVKIGKSKKVEKAFENVSFERPLSIKYLSSGNLMVEDNIDSQNATRVRKFNKSGVAYFDTSLANYINMGLYQYEDVNGNIVDISDIGHKNFQVTIKDKNTKSVQGIVNVDSVEESPEMYRGISLLGVDKKGMVYFYLIEEPNSPSEEIPIWKHQKMYVMRVDPKTDKSETMQMENRDGSLGIATGYSYGLDIKLGSDGSIYQLQMNSESYKIYKYKFD